MMNLFVVLTIVVGVVQVCTPTPVSVDEPTPDVTKLFTPEELKLARSAGIRDRELVNGKRRGVTVDEMVKLYRLVKSSEKKPTLEDYERNTTRPVTFEEMTQVCEIFVPHHKTVATYSKEQEACLNELSDSMDTIPQDVYFLHLRNSLCPYMSEPVKYEVEARSFGMKVVPYITWRFWQKKNKSASGVERVKVAKELCCIYQGHDNINKLKVQINATSLSNERMVTFSNKWNQFEKANTPKSFEEVCDFLDAANPKLEC